MHAHAIGVSFPCVNLKNKGSPEPQKIKLSERKVTLLLYISEKSCTFALYYRLTHKYPQRNNNKKHIPL